MGKYIDIKQLKIKFKYILFMILIVSVLIFIDIFLNDTNNKKKELKDSEVNLHSLVINEVMSSNEGAYIDEDGNLYDWIEIYNGTGKDINLSGYGLSDDKKGKIKWIFPDVTIKSNQYMIVYLTGKSLDGMHANFALSRNGGEMITLKNKKGKVVDSVRTTSIDSNSVMARDTEGNWIITDEITPGYSNNKEGRDNYIGNINDLNNNLVKINEILPKNKGIVVLNDELTDYVEILNDSNEDINLSDYYLSDDISAPYKWKLPNITLKSKEIYLVTSELDNFKLSSKNGIVLLSSKQKILSKVEYTNLTKGLAYVLIDNEYVETTNISPGYSNDSIGSKEFNKKYRKTKDGLIINEVMNNNHKVLAQNGGEYYDWIELYNNSNSTINLSDYTITNDDDKKDMYRLPDVELKSKEYYVIMLSGNIDYSNDDYIHANFKLSNNNGIFLYKNDNLMDSIYISGIPTGYSYGHGIDSGLYYYENPTPNKDNGEGLLEISFSPKFSIKPGIYNDKVEVSLNGMGTIYYTLDGDIPTKSSNMYNGTMTLDKTTVIRAVAYQDDRRVSEVVTGSYIIGENHALPVLSISLPDTDFAVLNNNLSSSITVSSHAELYEKDKSFSIDCGLKLFGGQTRYIPKKSFALKFSSKYGPSKLNYKVFDNSDAQKYDTLVVRSGSQDSTASMIRDELATSIMNDYGTVDVQAYKAVILYINGDYRGVYFLREKVDEEFVSHHYNVDEDGTNIVRIDNVVDAGSSKDYDNLNNYIKTHDMSLDESYEYVSSKLDIDNFIDYLIGEIYTTNNDIVNTRYFNNPNIDNGKIKMVFYDFDFGFYNYDKNYLTWLLNPNGLGEHKYNNTIIKGLFKNENFKKRFLERASYNMKNVWSEENLNNRYNELIKLIEPEMNRNQERWGSSYSKWQEECELLKEFINKRRQYVLSSIKSYYNLSEEDMRYYFG